MTPGWWRPSSDGERRPRRFVFFRERIGRLQAAGIAVIIVGMVLLS